MNTDMEMPVEVDFSDSVPNPYIGKARRHAAARALEDALTPEYNPEPGSKYRDSGNDSGEAGHENP